MATIYKYKIVIAASFYPNSKAREVDVRGGVQLQDVLDALVPHIPPRTVLRYVRARSRCSIVRSLPLTPAFWSLALSRFEYAKTTRGGEERFVVIVNEGELADYLVGQEPELHVDKSINSWGVFAMPPPRPPPLPRHWVRPAETTLNPAPSSPIANVVYIYTKQHMAHELAREFGAKYDAEADKSWYLPPSMEVDIQQRMIAHFGQKYQVATTGRPAPV